jgi:methionyl-tRNA synthetase
MANATNLHRERYYITTAIAYPNGVPHIGHAYEAIATDALARFARLDGRDVFFLTGTDEHGLKMIQTAEAESLPTMEVATRNALRFKEMDQRLNVSFDRFIRTTEEQHHRSSQELWKRIADNGDIYLDSYAGWYRCATRLITPKTKPFSARTTCGAGHKARRSNGWRRKVISSLSPIRTNYSRSMRSAGFHGPTRAGTKPASSKAACETSIATTFDWGVKVLTIPSMSCGRLARRLDQLHHRRRLSR